MVLIQDVICGEFWQMVCLFGHSDGRLELASNLFIIEGQSGPPDINGNTGSALEYVDQISFPPCGPTSQSYPGYLFHIIQLHPYAQLIAV